MIITICALHFIAQLSPGPDVLLVAKSAVSNTRAQSLSIILGISVGVLVWVLLTLLGFNVIIQQWPWIQQIIMLVGAIFLARMGYAMLKGGCLNYKNPIQMDVAAQESIQNRFFFVGLMTNLSNPKIVIYFSSVFSLALASSASDDLTIPLALIIPAQTFITFTLLFYILSQQKIKSLYQSVSHCIDIISGALFLFFSFWLLWDVLRVYI